MLSSAAKFLNNEKPHTAVSVWVDTLCGERYEEDDLDGLPELVSSINFQSSGPTEAARAIRKKLKYSNVHGQLRALTILRALVTNSGTRFQRTFADERLVERIKLLAGDPYTDASVKKKLMSILQAWQREFKDDAQMRHVAALYSQCGGGKKTDASEAYARRQKQYEAEARERAARKEDERRERMLAKLRETRSPKPAAGQTRRPPFNLTAEKSNILASVAQGTQAAQRLINALKLINREKESVTENVEIQAALHQAKIARKALIRYIQLVEGDAAGDYISTLIHANEQILDAMTLYDQMSKPVDLDSDDEEVARAKQAMHAQRSLAPLDDDDDAASLRSRLSHVNLMDTEIDKLQYQQKHRIDRFNYSQGHYDDDLADLDFSGKRPSIANSSISIGSLGAYSDYSDSEVDGYDVDLGKGKVLEDPFADPA